jgi:transcription elongation GreA/GreB family factor
MEKKFLEARHIFMGAWVKRENVDSLSCKQAALVVEDEAKERVASIDAGLKRPEGEKRPWSKPGGECVPWG